MISSIYEYKIMTNQLDTVTKDKYSIKINGDKIKVMPTEIDGYRKIVKLIKDTKVQHHIYQLIQDITFKVVIKDLHYNTDKSDLKTELEEKGFKVTNIYTPISKITKKPLSMHFLNLLTTDNIKEIYDIKGLLNCRISIESPRKARNIALNDEIIALNVLDIWLMVT